MRFLAALLFVTATSQAEPTIAEIHASRRSARDVTSEYLSRIQKLDPKLHAVLEVNPNALAIAAALDGAKKRGPLHGIPILLKDNLATFDMQTTGGSLALMGVKPPKDAFVVARLRAAGAVILGKTNLSEWANVRSMHASSGWSARGGQTRNPYDLSRTPCGSSSGTGAAIAADLAVAGVGTETDGSIMCPSSAQSLVGIKPTVGLVSRTGIIPISHTQDTAGPMARTVADAAALLTVMAGKDPADPATANSQPRDYTKFLDAGGLRGARIGVPRAKVFGISPAADRVTEEAIAVLKQKGAVIVDPADIPHLGEYDDEEFDVLLYEMNAELPSYLSVFAPGSSLKTLGDVIAWNRAHPEELTWFGQELFEKAAKLGPLTEPRYVKALEKCRRLARTEGLDVVFAQHKLDVLIAPTGGPPWMIDLVTGDHFGMSSSSPAAVAGYPAITVPAGWEHDLPMGVTFMGKAWDEGTLIKIAYAFEQATHARKSPSF